MVKRAIAAALISLTFSCNNGPFLEPRNVDWKEEWQKNSDKLKSLNREILLNIDNKYEHGNNEFPDNFSFPFDQGFYVDYGKTDSLSDTANISIRYYIDRGLMDHFSAFIFTKDTVEIKQFEGQISRKENDFKLEPNWYIIND